MEEIISPIHKKNIEKDLSKLEPVRETKNGSLVYITNSTHKHILDEIGRLRELSFRKSGAGSGKEKDIDKFDTFFKQMIIIDPEKNKIIGGYRFLEGNNIKAEKNQIYTPMGKLFDTNQAYIKDDLPKDMELGRSFISPDYMGDSRSFDDLWMGIAAAARLNEAEGLLGKITIYNDKSIIGTDFCLAIMQKYYGNSPYHFRPKKGLEAETTEKYFEISEQLDGNNIKNDFRKIKNFCDYSVVDMAPMLKAYSNITSDMEFFGASKNKDFGYVIEAGIRMLIKNIKKDKKERYLDSYNPKVR